MQRAATLSSDRPPQASLFALALLMTARATEMLGDRFPVPVTTAQIRPHIDGVLAALANAHFLSPFPAGNRPAVASQSEKPGSEIDMRIDQR